MCGAIIPLPTYPLSAIHPEGSIPSSNPEASSAATSCMDPGQGSEAHMNPPLSRTRIRVVHARAPVLDRPRIAAVAPVRAGEEGAVHHDSRSPGAPPRR